jgi:hypothetical protein
MGKTLFGLNLAHYRSPSLGRTERNPCNLVRRGRYRFYYPAHTWMYEREQPNEWRSRSLSGIGVRNAAMSRCRISLYTTNIRQSHRHKVERAKFSFGWHQICVEKNQTRWTVLHRRRCLFCGKILQLFFWLWQVGPAVSVWPTL